MKRLQLPFLCAALALFTGIPFAFGQVQIDKDFQFVGAPGNRDLTGAETVDASIGYLVNGAASNGTFLRGNGNHYVASTIQPTDLPAGSGNYVQNQTAAAQAGDGFWVAGSGRVNQNLTAGTGVSVDNSNSNTGAISASSLTFGSAATEGIASKRNSGGNQNGLDFYTASTARVSITNAGNVGIGTNAPAQRLDVAGAVALNGKLGISESGNWLRLNQSGLFSNGTYTPGFLRADGGIAAGGVSSLGAGTIHANGQVRAPILYDYNNTAYYVDPASDTRLDEVYSSGWFRNEANNTGLYNQANAAGIYSTGSKLMSMYNGSSLVIPNPGYLDFQSTTRQMINLWGGGPNASYGIGVQSSTLYYRSASTFAWHMGGTHTNTTANAGTGGTNLMYLNSTELNVNTDLRAPKCRICLYYCDNNCASTTHVNIRKRCVSMIPNSVSPRLDFSGDVDSNDDMWIGFECD